MTDQATTVRGSPAHADAPAILDEPSRRIFSVAVDGVAEAALRAGRERTTDQRCDACDGLLAGEPAGRGLYMWTRGSEIRFEEPALCDACATAIGVTALAAWSVEEEEG